MSLRSKWSPGKEEVVAQNGIVTAMESPSAEAGMEMLQKGGNAIDAGVAMGFCNVVLEPYMATIGGMGYMLIYLAEEGKTVAIDFNGRAPRNAHTDMYRTIGPAQAGGYSIFDVEGDAHNQGALCATVPATCAGLCEAHKRYGKLPLEQVFEPAIHLASEGFEANWALTIFTANNVDKINRDPYLASMWLPNGRAPSSATGSAGKIIQKDLGDLLKRIAKHGADAMYKGEVADAIDEFMRKNGGLLTKQDLEDYTPGVTEPLSMNFKDHTIKVVPTPSGGITNLQTFGILDNFDLESLGHNSVDYLHTFIQSTRHAFADRFRYLGDWEHASVPLDGLLSSEYHKELASQVNPRRADVGVEQDEEPWIYYMERTLHDLWKHDPSRAPDKALQPAMDDNDEDTTHFNVVDKDRNAVSCTHTGVFTAGTNSHGTGAYLVGGMGWFIPKGRYPNSLGSWKRPMNNMAPSMVFRDGKPVLCQGAPGARRIMNRNVQIITNIVVFGMSPQEAILAPAIDTSGKDTLVDYRVPDEVVAELERRGHRIKLVEDQPGMPSNFARPSAIQIDYETELLRAGIDPFRPTMALGY